MNRWVAGGGGSVPVVRAARITSGGFNPLPNTAAAWQALAGFELDVPARAGDWVEVAADFLMATGGAGFLDLAVMVGSSLVRFGGTGTSTPAIEGNPGWYPASGFAPSPGVMGLTLSSGDLDSGQARFVLACKSNGTGRLYADANYPFRWRAINFGAVK